MATIAESVGWIVLPSLSASEAVMVSRSSSPALPAYGHGEAALIRATAGREGLRHGAGSLAIQIAVDIVLQRPEDQGFGTAGVLKSSSEGHVATGLWHARWRRGLAERRSGQHVCESDSCRICCRCRVAFVITQDRGNGIDLVAPCVAADGFGEAARVGASRREGLRHGAGSLAIQIAVNIVLQRPEDQGLGSAGVLNPSGEGHAAAELWHARWRRGLAERRSGQHVCDRDGCKI